MPSMSMDVPLTIPAILRRLGTHFGDKTVVSRRGAGALHQTTYREILTRAGQLAAVVLKEAREVSVAALLTWLADGVPRWWVPDALVFIEAIPRTSTGKFLKTALRERYQGWYTSA